MELRGKIKKLEGTFGSGLAILYIETDIGTQRVYCENAQTVRALDAMFDNVIGPGHTVNQEAIVGQEVICMVGADDMLESMKPIGQHVIPLDTPEPMTYNQLAELIKKIPADHRDDHATIYLRGMDEWFPVCGWGVADVTDVLDEGHPFLEIDA